MARRTIIGCLLVSGFTALVYQIVWVRLLGLAFGTTTEAIAVVLAVFFGGLALGNALAARTCRTLQSPLRLYGALELFIGAFALVSLVALENLHRIYAWLPAVESPSAWTAIQLAATAVLLLPPTMAMGATLPVVSRGLVVDDARRGRWSALLYAANTAGAVAGAYLSGYWLIPALGFSRCAIGAAVANLGVGAVALLLARDARTPLPDADPAPARRRPFLLYFGLSGFVAIGYEVVWSKAFGLVMEGTLAGFTAVLSGFLLGIAAGSALMARRVDRLANLPAVFAGLHLGIAALVVAGAWAVPHLPWLYAQLAGGAGAAAPHLLFALVLPLVVAPTLLFGAAFPVLVRHYTSQAGGVGRGMGEVTAANTLGSIGGSLCVGLWWIPALGSDATLYLLVVVDLVVALWILLRHATPESGRLRTLAGATALAATLALSYNGVGLTEAVSGKQLARSSWSAYRAGLEKGASQRLLSIEGRSSLVSVYDHGDRRGLYTNGLPEAAFHYGPPHLGAETAYLALYPYVAAARPERALVIGLGGGNTLASLLRTPIARVEVVELERGVIDAVELLHRGRENPLEDPRVALRLGDGRNDLLRRIARGEAGYDLIASQPSHPWRVGAANLFTEDFFRIARKALAENGAFAAWVAGFRTDRESFLAVVASFERVFPGAVLADVSDGRRSSFLLLGARQPVRLDPEAIRALLDQPGAAELLHSFEVRDVESFLADFEGSAAAFARLAPEASNRDDNAFVETRISHLGANADLDFAAIERELPEGTPVLPPLEGAVDVAALADRLLARIRRGSSELGKLERLLATHAASLDPEASRARLAAARLRDPAQRTAALEELEGLGVGTGAEAIVALRLLAAHWERVGELERAAKAYARAWRHSEGTEDALNAAAMSYRLDPARARPWLARIPDSRRGDFPVLALYELGIALREGRRGAALRPRYERAQAFQAHSNEPRTSSFHDLLAAAARTLGEDAAARAHADAAAALRRREVEALLARARKLSPRDPGAAWQTLEKARSISASYPPLLELRVRVAALRSDPEALERALAELRFWGPSRAAGIGAENRLRAELGLPLRLGSSEPADRS